MSLLNGLKSLLDRRFSAQPPANNHSGKAASSERLEAPTETGRRDQVSGLKNSIARGSAEGAVRETVRELIREIMETFNA